MKIITTDNPILFQETEKVKTFDKKLLDIIEQMKVTLDNTTDPKGVGLAAPQVGIPLKLFLAKPNNKSKIFVFINPEVVENTQEVIETQTEESPKKKGKKEGALEGCLSVPNIWSPVKRKSELTISYQNEKGKKFTKTFKGFIATIIQHEIDHLNGVLFTKRAVEQNQKIYRSYKNRENEDEFEEIKV